MVEKLKEAVMLLKEYIFEKQITEIIQRSKQTAESSIVHNIFCETNYSENEIKTLLQNMKQRGKLKQIGYSLFFY